MLDEARSKDEQPRYAQTDTHAIDNSHMRESISGAYCGVYSSSQISPVIWSSVVRK
jgi:hypothetical protein